MDTTINPSPEEFRASSGQSSAIYTHDNPEYDSAKHQNFHSNILNQHDQAFVATRSSVVSANQIYSRIGESQWSIQTLNNDSERQSGVVSNSTGTGRSHASLPSLHDDIINSRMGSNIPGLYFETQFASKAPYMQLSGESSQVKLSLAEAVDKKANASATLLKVSGMFDETIALRGQPAPPTPVPYRTQRPITIRAKYLTNSWVNSTTSEKDDKSCPISPENVPWTDRGWQEQQASKHNPNGEDLILGHPIYFLEFKDYLRGHDKFSLDKLQELEHIAAVTHTQLGWFHHDMRGVKCLHRQWILILARNLEALRSAPPEVRNAYWLQKANAFDSIYNYWMQNLGLNPGKGLKGQEVPIPAHPPLDDQGNPLIDLPYSDSESSDKENLGPRKPRGFMRRAWKVKVSTIKATKALTSKATLPRSQRAKNIEISTPQPSRLRMSNKRSRDEGVDELVATSNAPKRPRG